MPGCDTLVAKRVEEKLSNHWPLSVSMHSFLQCWCFLASQALMIKYVRVLTRPVSALHSPWLTVIAGHHGSTTSPKSVKMVDLVGRSWRWSVNDGFNSSGSIHYTCRVAEWLARAWASLTPWRALTRSKTDWKVLDSPLAWCSTSFKPLTPKFCFYSPLQKCKLQTNVYPEEYWIKALHLPLSTI